MYVIDGGWVDRNKLYWKVWGDADAFFEMSSQVARQLVTLLQSYEHSLEVPVQRMHFSKPKLNKSSRLFEFLRSVRDDQKVFIAPVQDWGASFGTIDRNGWPEVVEFEFAVQFIKEDDPLWSDEWQKKFDTIMAGHYLRNKLDTIQALEQELSDVLWRKDRKKVLNGVSSIIPM